MSDANTGPITTPEFDALGASIDRLAALNDKLIDTVERHRIEGAVLEAQLAASGAANKRSTQLITALGVLLFISSGLQTLSLWGVI